MVRLRLLWLACDSTYICQQHSCCKVTLMTASSMNIPQGVPVPSCILTKAGGLWSSIMMQISVPFTHSPSAALTASPLLAAPSKLPAVPPPTQELPPWTLQTKPCSKHRIAALTCRRAAEKQLSQCMYHCDSSFSAALLSLQMLGNKALDINGSQCFYI